MRSNKPQSRLLVRGSVLYHDFVFRRRNRWYHWVAGLGLWLLSWLYRAALVLRRSWPEPAVRVPCRVISVGNLVIGGSGKTPVVGWLARALRERGLTTAVLCRGHGGAWVHQARVFHDGVEMHGSATDGGDEAAMLATRLAGLGIPILVGRRRADTARLACERFHPDVLLIDDGLQHGSLEKDYEIVTFNGSNPIGVGQVLPFGPLREPTSALERCH
ncbi:MAG: tetraacyldisaccharide 4'-kinase, partial [Myxococcales bacterium]|nr:tetraacyldisaccharide 4'-kinase [Myxococcales bacterium]